MDRPVVRLFPAAAAWGLEARALLRWRCRWPPPRSRQMVILATDTVMLGHFSKDALAAAALGNTIFLPGLADGLRLADGGIAGDRAYPGRPGTAATTRPARNHRGRAPRGGAHGPVVGGDGLSLPLLCCCFSPAILLALFLARIPTWRRARRASCPPWPGACPSRWLSRCCAVFPPRCRRPVPPLVVMGLAILFNATGRLCADLRPFRSAAAGPVGRGHRQRQFQFLQLCRMLAFCLLAPRLRDAIASCTGCCGRTGRPWRNCCAWAYRWASPWCSKWRCSMARPWRWAFRHCLDCGAPDRHHHSLPHLHGAAGHRAGRHGAGGLAAGAGDAIGGARRAGFTAIAMAMGSCAARRCCCCCFPHHRQPVAARHAGKCERAGAGGDVPACRGGLPVDGRGAGDGGDEPARIERRALADVAGGRVLLAGGRADVRIAGLWHGAERAWASGWGWRSACWWRRSCSARGFSSCRGAWDFKTWHQT
jgi:hypothetical protein